MINNRCIRLIAALCDVELGQLVAQLDPGCLYHTLGVSQGILGLVGQLTVGFVGDDPGDRNPATDKTVGLVCNAGSQGQQG